MLGRKLLALIDSVHVDRACGDRPEGLRAHRARLPERDGLTLRFTATVASAPSQHRPERFIEMDEVRRLWEAGEMEADELLCGLFEFASRDPDGYAASVEGREG